MQIAADLGFEVVERDIARGELYQADEVFLTGTAAEIVPVREIDDHLLGEPGEITQAIQKRFFEAIQGKRDEYLEWLDFVDLDAGRAPTERAGQARGRIMTCVRLDAAGANYARGAR